MRQGRGLASPDQIGMNLWSPRAVALAPIYFFQKFSTAFIRRLLSVVT